MAQALLMIEALRAQQYEARRRSTRLRRRLRDEADVLGLPDVEFSAHYRLTKELFTTLCTELAPLLPRPKRRTRISVECKVLTALSFYATGSYQKPVGMSYMHGLSQASVSNAVKEVTDALNHNTILRKYIRFPQNRDERRILMNKFSRKFGIHGVVGCIDCTHVALIRPTHHEERFFNRKHYHSRNVQIICDSDLNILNIDATFGGSAHDAFIWNNSEINAHIQEVYNTGERIWLLGDSGYPLRPWLMTPIVNAVPGSADEHYTNIHCKARNTVERCIGVLKARWRCLLSHRVLHYDHGTVAKIINACSVLHNMANRAGLPAPQMANDEAARDLELQVQVEIPQEIPGITQLEAGRRQRDIIVQRLWSNRVQF